jgi:hypothetical protein
LAKAAAEAKAVEDAKAVALAKASASAAVEAQQQRVIQVVGATVTSGIGYGLYWFFTQGD